MPGPEPTQCTFGRSHSTCRGEEASSKHKRFHYTTLQVPPFLVLPRHTRRPQPAEAAVIGELSFKLEYPRSFYGRLQHNIQQKKSTKILPVAAHCPCSSRIFCSIATKLALARHAKLAPPPSTSTPCCLTRSCAGRTYYRATNGK